jgi:hypothetical protein
MKAHTASFINALILIGFGLWAYFASETPSKTAFIPVCVGIALLAMFPGVKKEDKIVAHIAVLLTLIILVGLVMPLKGALGRGDGLAIMRVLVMIVSSVVALFFFIKSFFDVRRARAARAASEE